MTSRPPSSSSAPAATTSRTHQHPTPHSTAPRSRSISSTRAPPQAPRPNRRPQQDLAQPRGTQSTDQPIFALAATQSRVPRASVGKKDDMLAPPDAQSCPFAKAGVKIVGIGNGPYGELEGWLEWPPELYAEERMLYSHFLIVSFVDWGGFRETNSYTEGD